jgi:hypothetical protein
METTIVKKDNSQALALRKVLHRLRRRREKLDKEIIEKTKLFQESCTHNETEIKDSYVSGGYLDRCQYIKTTYCLICGKELKEDITYGGFN